MTTATGVGHHTTADLDQITRALHILGEPDSVMELRVLGVPRVRVAAGYFDDPALLAHAAARWSGRADGVYITLNRVTSALLARANNRVIEGLSPTTSDTDIAHRTRLLVDFDPRRPAGISATDAEHDTALERARHARAALEANGFPPMLLADSGNGAHLICGLDLPNNPETRTLVERVLKALDLRFGDEVVTVDCSTFNASRVSKLYGTFAAKGDATADRPHRLARILDSPQVLQPVPIDLLEGLAAAVPDDAEIPSRGRARQDSGGMAPLVEASISTSGSRCMGCGWRAPVPGRADANWCLISASGTRAMWRGQRSSCSSPTVRSPLAVCTTAAAASAGRTSVRCSSQSTSTVRHPLDSTHTFHHRATRGPSDRPWPAPSDAVVYRGLAGDIVEAIMPHTEADPVAVLVNILVGFGNAAGDGPHMLVGATKHTAREFAVLVGRTGKARKGESWNPPRVLLEHAVPDWAVARIASGMSSGEGLIHEVRDPVEKQEPIKEKGKVTGYQTVIADEGEADKRLLVIEPELARPLRAMSRQGNTLESVLRDAWDRGNLRVMTRTNPLRATGAHISVIGHVTVDELRRELADVSIANGFANRILWLCVRRSKDLPEPVPFAGEMVQRLAGKLAVAAGHARVTGRMERDPDAREVWRQVYPDLAADRDGLAGALLARAEAHVLRLSLIYALLDGSATVTADHLLAALALWEYVEASVEYIFGDATGDPIADTILAALRQAGELSRTQISDLFGRNASSDRIARALQALLGFGKARMEQRETGGRPREVWVAC